MSSIRHSRLIHILAMPQFVLAVCLTDTTDRSCASGTLFVGYTAIYAVPNAILRFFKVPGDTLNPVYETKTDSLGEFCVCPFDTGLYRWEIYANIDDELRIKCFEHYGLCVPKKLSKVIPKMTFNNFNSRMAFGLINEEDPFHPPDRESCCAEFKRYVGDNNSHCNEKASKAKRRRERGSR